MATPPLGFIRVQDRTQAQHDAHARAVQGMVKFSLPPVQLAKGESVRLFEFLKHPDVVADVGFKFDRIHQLTGSCVWAGGTNALFSTIAAQRLAAENPTLAFLPFTLHNYALSRHYMGDDGQGEGSMGSTFFKSLNTDGVRDWRKTGLLLADNLPGYTDSDGISVTSDTEMAWSSVRNPGVQMVLQTSKQHLTSATGECKTVMDIRAMNVNGYGVSFACDRYIGNGSVRGSGANARVMGRWDGSGGHQQSIHAYEEHPDFGPIYWAQNNWPGSTYPADPGGGPVCGVWVLEKDVEAAMNMGGEVYGISHLNWFPAQPKVIDYYA